MVLFQMLKILMIENLTKKTFSNILYAPIATKLRFFNLGLTMILFYQ